MSVLTLVHEQIKSHPNDVPRSRHRLTNRRGIKGKTENAVNSSFLDTIDGTEYGLDFLGISFPIPEPGHFSSRWAVRYVRHKNGTVTETRTLTLRKNSRKHIYVVVYEVPRGPHWGPDYRCGVSFNPARYVDDGILLGDVKDLDRVTDYVLKMVGRHVEIHSNMPPEYIRVTRLDVACNFYDVFPPARYFLGLQFVARPYATVDELICGNGVPQTLRSGSPSGGFANLYDQHAKRPNLAPPGTMRFEVQAHRGGWLKKHGILTLADITEKNVDNLFWDRIDWFGLENEVMTSTTACERIARAKHITPTTKINLEVFMFDRLKGVKSEVDPKTATKYKRMLRDLGVAPFLESQIDESITRLDVSTYGEVQIA